MIDEKIAKPTSTMTAYFFIESKKLLTYLFQNYKSFKK